MLSFLKLLFLCSLHAGAWWESYTCLVGGERTSKRGAWGREIHSHHVAQLQEATFLAALEHLYKEPHVHPEAMLPSTPDPYDAVSLKLSFFFIPPAITTISGLDRNPQVHLWFPHPLLSILYQINKTNNK